MYWLVLCQFFDISTYYYNYYNRFTALWILSYIPLTTHIHHSTLTLLVSTHLQ